MTVDSEKRRRKVRNAYRRMNLKRLRRWWRERCSACGHRTWFGESAYSHPGSGIFHDYCSRELTQRHRAEDAMAVLDAVTETWQVDAATVKALMGLRAQSDGYEASNAENRAFRVFRELEHRREREQAVSS